MHTDIYQALQAIINSDVFCSKVQAKSQDTVKAHI